MKRMALGPHMRIRGRVRGGHCVSCIPNEVSLMTLTIEVRVTAERGRLIMRHGGGPGCVWTHELSPVEAVEQSKADDTLLGLYNWIIDRFAEEASRAIEKARKGSA